MRNCWAGRREHVELNLLTKMLIYIVTPTFNALDWLKGCMRSVADQVGAGVEVHHHVQDGGSTDGTPAWLAEWQAAHAAMPGYRFSYESGRDKGMYDALNLAWEKLPPEAGLTAHLNSDEQYAPGALAAVAAEMARHPKADMALCAYVILNEKGQYICHRRPVKPCRWGSRATCEVMTCSTFFRADAFRRFAVRFDTRYSALADLVFYRDIMAHAPRVRVLPRLISSYFTVTGGNLAWTETSRCEWEQYRSELPWPLNKLCRVASLRVNGTRFLTDKLLCRAPRRYEPYMPGEDQRREMPIAQPTALWGVPVN